MALDKGGETKGVVNKGGDKNEALSKVELTEKSRVSQISRLDEAQVQAIVEKAVEKAVGEAIKPLVRSFTEMTQKNSLTTIIGGIGYILGLMGIALYFKSRKGS
jgi:nickel transport protein